MRINQGRTGALTCEAGKSPFHTIPSPRIIAVCRKDHLSYTSSRPFWWSSGYSVYSRLHGRYAPGHHGGKCATNSTASCSLPGQWPCLLRSRSLRSITCPVQTGFGSLWALLGSSGCAFSSTRSLVVRGFDGAASSLSRTLVWRTQLNRQSVRVTERRLRCESHARRA